MPSFRFLALVAVAAALVVVAPAIGVSGAAQQNAVPPVQAAGVDAAPVIPSIVNTRLVRAQSALERATADFDENQAASAVVPMNAAVDNLTKGWNATKWLIQTSTPPPGEEEEGPEEPETPDDDAATYAGPEDTAFALFSAQHDLVSTSVGMMETGNAALLTSLRNSITAVQSSRIAAITYIASIAPPAGEDGAIIDGPEGESSWETVMPNLVTQLNDEIQQLNGRLALYKFTASARTAIVNARTRAQNARALVNQYWSPVAED